MARKVQSQKATGTDGKPTEAVGEILSKSCFSGDSIRSDTKLCENKTSRPVEIMPLSSGNKPVDSTISQKVKVHNRMRRAEGESKELLISAFGFGVRWGRRASSSGIGGQDAQKKDAAFHLRSSKEVI